MKRSKCTFVPTCSNYTVESLKEYGAMKGSVLGAWRVLRCNPFNKAYHDPPAIWGDKLHFKQTQKLNGKING